MSGNKPWDGISTDTWIGQKFKKYNTEIEWDGGKQSHAAKDVVGEAHAQLWESMQGIMTEDGKIQLGEFILSLETDWLWTKIQIYMKRFELYFKEYEKNWKKKEDLAKIEKYTEKLWDRMLADLAAMLFDDGINWELAIAFTNIIDTNKTSWERADIFFKGFRTALWKSILKDQVALTNWETAGLWENGKFERLINRLKKTNIKNIQDIRKLREALDIARKISSSLLLNGTTEGAGILKQIKILKESIDLKKIESRELRKYIIASLQELELNLAWTFLWVKKAWVENEKLKDLEEWDIIIALSERPTDEWILSARCNGYTLIRESMVELLGEDWHDKTFEDYLEVIWWDACKLPNWLVEQLRGLEMWDIATGETTVYNSFIADELLWWLNWLPNVKISCLRHWTGDPQYKLASWLGERDDLMFDMDISKQEIPQIFILIQVALWLSDQQMAKSFNMGLPYTIICKPWEEDKILEKANNSDIRARVVWEVKKRKDSDPSVILRWVWMWESEVIYPEQKAA